MAFELSTTRCSSFWTNEPKHIIIAIRAMFESISFDMPIPIGLPLSFSFGAARRTSSQVFGFIPISPQMSVR